MYFRVTRVVPVLYFKQLTTAQIIPGSQIQQHQVQAGGQPIATLVKTVSSSQGQSVASVNIPISSVNLGLNLPTAAAGQQKTLQGKVAASQGAALQVRQVQQPRKAVTARVASEYQRYGVTTWSLCQLSKLMVMCIVLD